MKRFAGSAIHCFLCFAIVICAISVFASESSQEKQVEAVIPNWQWSLEIIQSDDLLKKPNVSKWNEAQKKAKEIGDKLKKKIQKECKITLYDNPPFLGTIKIQMKVGGSTLFELDDGDFQENRAATVARATQQEEPFPIADVEAKNKTVNRKEREYEVQSIAVTVSNLQGNQSEYRIQKQNDQNISKGFDDLIKRIQMYCNLYSDRPRKN